MKVDQAKEHAKAILSGGSSASGNPSEALDILESYECWTPFFQLIDFEIEQDNDSELLLRRKARTQLRLCEDVSGGAQTYCQLISKHAISFPTFYQEMLRPALDPDDWSSELEVLKKCEGCFAAPSDQVLCLERISWLLEKKAYDDDALVGVYRSILAIDANNIKSLRHFKTLHTHNREWNEAAKVLERLIDATDREQEKFRYGQELAALQLYQLQAPEQCLAVLDRYCKDSPLNTSMIRYEANEMLSRWEACLEILKEVTAVTTDGEDLAISRFKEGTLLQRLDRLDEARDSFVAAMEANDGMLEPVEQLITISISCDDWDGAKRYAQILASKVQSKNLATMLDGAIERLAKAIDTDA